MHMADALISPVVGGAMWVVTAAVAQYSVKKVETEKDDKAVALMAVLGAFVFAAQMINFTIPATGSSGHLGGGLLLAALLGPYAGFLTITAILAIQALFFADGGLLALGCNIFNLGFLTCFVAYPLIYKPIMRDGFSRRRFYIATMLAAVIGLQLGAFSVVLQTFFSGRSELPFTAFILLMQPIHLAIGIVEGLITVAVLLFIWANRPELIAQEVEAPLASASSMKRALVVLAIAAAITGTSLSWFASNQPDGLEWAVAGASGKEELENPPGFHQRLADLQEKIAFLPDYTFKKSNDSGELEPGDENWPNIDPGRSLSGVIGGLLTLTFAGGIGYIISFFKKRKRRAYCA